MYIIILSAAMAQQPMVEVQSCASAHIWFAYDCDGEVIIDCFESYDGIPEVSSAVCDNGQETVPMEGKIKDYWDALTLGITDAWNRNFGCYSCEELTQEWKQYCNSLGLFVSGFMCAEDWKGCALEDAQGACTSDPEKSIVLDPEDW